MIVILVRHGEAQGEGDCSLTVRGREQAKAVAKKLSGLAISKVYSSDYLRAKETMQEFVNIKPGIPVIISSDLREMYRFIVGGPEKQGTRDNRVKEDIERADRFFDTLTEQSQEEVIVVFTHGNIIRYYISKALNIDPKTMWSGVLLKCGSLSVLQIMDGVITIKSIDETNHLPKEDILNFYAEAEKMKYLP